jgi:putative redox protein
MTADTPTDRAPLAIATIGPTGYRVDLESLGHPIASDEPIDEGGTGEGPGPFALLYASLGACVLMTLRMYAGRKEWPMTGATLRLYPQRKRGAPIESIDMELALEGDLSEEQRARLLEIAGRCPVHRSLEHGVHIETRLA